MFARLQSPADVSQNKFKSGQKLLITSHGLSPEALLCPKHIISTLSKKREKHISFWTVQMFFASKSDLFFRVLR
jgi:hypothetical protein